MTKSVKVGLQPWKTVSTFILGLVSMVKENLNDARTNASAKKIAKMTTVLYIRTMYPLAPRITRRHITCIKVSRWRLVKKKREINKKN